MLPPVLTFTVGDTKLDMIGGKDDDFVLWTQLKPKLADASMCPSWSFALSNGVSQLWLWYEPGKSKDHLPATLDLTIREAIAIRIDLSAEDAQRLYDLFIAGSLFNGKLSKRVKISTPFKSSVELLSMWPRDPESAKWSQCEALEQHIQFL